MKECCGVGRLFGHKYVARRTITRRSPDYQTVKHLHKVYPDVSPREMAKLLESMQSVVNEYEGDVCIRCGRTVIK